MRLGVLDVGSNTVHLLVVDAHHGAAPRSAYSFKAELKLAELLEADGRIAPDGAHRLGEVVTQAHSVADDKGCEEVVAFATSALREAPNGDEVIADVAARSGVALAVLTGSDEARLTFLAVRRWFGWSSGRLLVLDIGGGSLEIAGGIDEDPDVAVSLPLGAGRLTRDWFSADPPPEAEVSALRRHVRTEVARQVGGVLRTGEPSRYVATSKTFKQLARLSGAPSSAEGPYVERFLGHAALQDWLPRLARLSSQQRTELPGVSPARARQLLAGAIVADAVMDLLGAKRLQICPWALREGVILRRLDMMDR